MKMQGAGVPLCFFHTYSCSSNCFTLSRAFVAVDLVWAARAVPTRFFLPAWLLHHCAAVLLWCAQRPGKQHWRRRSRGNCRDAEEQHNAAGAHVRAASLSLGA